jgi:hypothetical protein
MLWLQHVFAIWVLAHMIWAAVLLEREWRRVRGPIGPAHQQGLRDMPSALAGAEAPQGHHYTMIGTAIRDQA